MCIECRDYKIIDFGNIDLNVNKNSKNSDL